MTNTHISTTHCTCSIQTMIIPIVIASTAIRWELSKFESVNEIHCFSQNSASILREGKNALKPELSKKIYRWMVYQYCVDIFIQYLLCSLWSKLHAINADSLGFNWLQRIIDHINKLYFRYVLGATLHVFMKIEKHFPIFNIDPPVEFIVRRIYSEHEREKNWQMLVNHIEIYMTSIFRK